MALVQPKQFSSNEGGIYCIADIRGHFTHHDASFWIERWHRPALSRAALVLPFLVALGQAQIGKGVSCAKLRRRVRLAILTAIQVWLPESPEGRASRIWQDGIGIDFIASVYSN